MVWLVIRLLKNYALLTKKGGLCLDIEITLFQLEVQTKFQWEFR